MPKKINPTLNITAVDESNLTKKLSIVGEYPLTIYLDKIEIVTLMTIGQNPRQLCLGFLKNQNLISSFDQISKIQVDWDTNACVVTTKKETQNLHSKIKKRTITSGCGQGTMFNNIMDHIEKTVLSKKTKISKSTIFAITDYLRKTDSIYKSSGAVHGCALFKDRELVFFIEDVGRHNAIDTIFGFMLEEKIKGEDKIFYTTGRLTSEMVIKCIQMNISILISRSGLTMMGWEIATKFNLTMIGRAIGKHFLIFSGKERIL